MTREFPDRDAVKKASRQQLHAWYENLEGASNREQVVITLMIIARRAGNEVECDRLNELEVV